jgi:hypothetical protein
MRCKEINIVLCVALLLFLIAPMPAKAEELNHFRGVYTEIFYTEDSDLRKLNRRVSIRWLKIGSKPAGIKEMSLPGIVTKKFDVIRINVERILDMYPRGSLVGFNILSDQGEVEDVLWKKFRNKTPYRAFYSRRDKNIYLAAERANTNIVAHELAHAVVDLELGAAVPKAVHEILAKYVDTHLYD